MLCVCESRPRAYFLYREQQLDIGENTNTRGATVSLFDYFRIATREWRSILIIVLVTVVAMVIYLNVATYKFTATVKLTTTQSSSGLGSQIGNLGALASVAGVRLPQGSGEQNFLNFSQSLLSRSTAEGLLTHPALIHVMFEKEWDQRLQRWVEPRGAVKSITTFGRTMLGLPVFPYKAPNAARVQDYLEKNVAVAEDTRKPIIAMTFSDRDPEFAVKLLTAITTINDETLRRKSLARSKDYIAYLEDQLSSVQLAESRMALAAVLGEQTKLRMLASASAPFAAEQVSAIGVSDQPTTPKPIVFLIAAAIGGLILGFIFTLIRSGFQELPSHQ
jgi:uncharacterized protein involved in exopolysaccharide biosynthesis